ncbi:MAG: PAS domain S-box protein [Gemmatimonadota bacterium]
MSGQEPSRQELLAQVEQLRDQLRELREDHRAEQYRSVVDNVIDGIITIDESGTIQSFNPAAERLFGYPASEIVGRNVSLLMEEPHRSGHDGYLARYRRTGVPRVIGIGREAIGRRRDGTTFPIDLSVGEFVADGRRMYTGVVRDISSRVQAAADLRQSEERFRSLFQTVGSVIILLSPEARILEWNGEAERLIGWRREEVLGKDYLRMCIAEADREAVGAAIRRVLRGLPARGHENPVVTRDGSARVLVWNADRLVTADGAPVGVIACGQDISERKHLEAQLLQAQKMESIGQLAGGIAHDFNNQLGIILFDVDMLLAGAETGSALREDLQKIRKVVLRSADLTRQLLVFSRRQKIQLQPVQLNQHIRELQRMLGRILGEGVTLDLSLCEGHCVTNADPGNIDQVIINLCINARDAMTEGGAVAIETRIVLIGEDYARQVSRARPGRYCRLVVADTGDGMEEAVVARIFEPFFTTKETGKGTGLGLAVVYGIVEAHKGWIVVHSRPGEGSRFEIYLPSLEPEAGATADAAEAGPGQHWPGRGERLLIVEDEPELRERTERLLRRHGYDVTASGSAAEARAAYEGGGPFDLVLSDLVLPDGRGSELVAELVGRQPSLAVLVVTGYPDELAQWERADGDSHAVLQKPFAVTDLLRSLREVLDR